MLCLGGSIRDAERSRGQLSSRAAREYSLLRYQQCKFRPGALGTPVYAEIHRAGHHSSDVGERLFQIAVKIAVFAPMPSARASTATMVNRGVFVSMRNA